MNDKIRDFFKKSQIAIIIKFTIILFCLLSFVTSLPAKDLKTEKGLKCHVDITKKYVLMDEVREKLSLDYIREHYNLTPEKPHIDPRIIVIHWTAIHSFEDSYKTLYPSTLSTQRNDIASASNLNVCAHFLIKGDGSIFQLLPLPYFARHVIGLNYHAIGIENIGSNSLPLTDKQLASNTALIRCLLDEYPGIQYVIGHYEYQLFENSSFFLEIDPNYRTIKRDPGEPFMKKVRKELKDLYASGRLKKLINLNII
jgi:N-acetyl-anhydromuramyl-L-alanine amidase AmpD